MEQAWTGAGLDTGGGEHASAEKVAFVKRRARGVNLDDGVALTSPDDFERLHVAARTDETQRLREWLADPAAAALLLAGQTGSGKTTLVHDLLRGNQDQHIVRVQFDRLPVEDTHGAFLAVLFGSLLKEALIAGCSCDGLGVALSDFREVVGGDGFHSVVVPRMGGLGQRREGEGTCARKVEWAAGVW